MERNLMPQAMVRFGSARVAAALAAGVIGLALALAAEPAGKVETPATASAASASTQEAGGPWRNAALPDPAAGKDLLGAYMIDARTGWIVGASGLCLATRDGGKTWQVQDTGVKADLRAVLFLDAQRGFACGDGDPDAPPARGHVVWMGGGKPAGASILLRTADSGRTWKKLWAPTNFELTAIATPDGKALQLGNSGGARHLDGDILRGSDGGEGLSGKRAFRALFGVVCLDTKRWLAVGSPVSVGFMPAPDSPLYADKAARALFSADGGATWHVAKGSQGTGRQCLRSSAFLPTGNDAAEEPAAAEVPVAPTVVAVGDGRTILRSTDAGQSWRAVESGTKNDLLSVTACGRGFVAVGKAGTVLVSTDAGRTWSIAPSTASKADLHAVAEAGGNVLVVGSGGAAFTCPAADLAPPAKR